MRRPPPQHLRDLIEQLQEQPATPDPFAEVVPDSGSVQSDLAPVHPDSLDLAPYGIPPQYWQGQSVDGYSETPTADMRFPLIHLDLPRRYARPWRLICSAATNTIANGGTDPLVAGTPIALPLNNLGAVGLAAPAAQVVTAKLILDLGADVVFMDYPARGAVYSISAHKLDVYITVPPTIGLLGGRPARYHCKLEVGHAAPSWDRPTYTQRSALALVGSGVYQCAIPPRATEVTFMPNVSVTASGLPTQPVGRLNFYDITGTRMDSRIFASSANRNSADYAGWRYRVPPKASFAEAENTAAADTWTNPSLIFDLSI